MGGSDKIAALEKENSQLKSKIAELEETVRQLKGEVRTARGNSGELISWSDANGVACVVNK